VAEPIFDRRWVTATFAVAGLIVAGVAIGVVAIYVNRNIHTTVDDAIAFAVEFEDRGDDLRVAILDVRHYHRDLLLNNPSRPRIEAWRDRYTRLLVAIDAMDDVLRRSPPDRDLPPVGQLQRMAEAYYTSFSAVVDDPGSDEFIGVAEGLLPAIDSMEEIAAAVDDEGERRAGAAFVAIDEASATGTLILLGVIAAVIGLGTIVALLLLRLFQEQRRLAAIERAAAAQMAEVSRAKTDFIADASHELRTPLTVLRGNAEVGIRIQDDCAHGEILREIVDESARMSRLVDDLLFLARSDAASVPLEAREVACDDLVERLVARAGVLAGQRGAILETDIDADGRILLDPDRFEQAVLILVDNAAKYGPPGGRVGLTAWTDDRYLTVAVADRGQGIPDEQLSRIFERYYRLDGRAPERAAGGAGLGLSIAAAIVEGHGGRITASPRHGGGTVMTLRLPRSISVAVGPGPEDAATVVEGAANAPSA
jgi:two-component system sensor histidine kinase VicK